MGPVRYGYQASLSEFQISLNLLLLAFKWITPFKA